MQITAEDHVIYQIANAPIRPYPYPHLYVEDVFPDDFYTALRAYWPQASQLVSLASTGRVSAAYSPNRFVKPLRLNNSEVGEYSAEAAAFWDDAAKWMLGSDRFLLSVMRKFEPQLRKRFGSAFDSMRFTHEALVVRDHSNYRLGPHTDSPRKVIALLFYCPADASYAHLGTSIYVPIEKGFRCAGGAQYPFDRFRKMTTMAYKPNTLFAFVKTDNSFHGVDPIRDADVLRDLILYDVQVTETTLQEGLPLGVPAGDAAASGQGTPAKVGLGRRMLRQILGRGG